MCWRLACGQPFVRAECLQLRDDGYAFELEWPRGWKGAGPGEEVLHGGRDEDLAGLGLGGDARVDVDSDIGDLLVGALALAGMDAGADLESERGDGVSDRLAQWIARMGPLKVAKKPSPAVSISRPRTERPVRIGAARLLPPAYRQRRPVRARSQVPSWPRPPLRHLVVAAPLRQGEDDDSEQAGSHDQEQEHQAEKSHTRAVGRSGLPLCPESREMTVMPASPPSRLRGGRGAMVGVRDTPGLPFRQALPPAAADLSLPAPRVGDSSLSVETRFSGASAQT
jgi:hypothetical protein